MALEMLGGAFCFHAQTTGTGEKMQYISECKDVLAFKKYCITQYIFPGSLLFNKNKISGKKFNIL
jgi:hypothetical protein